MDSTRPIASSTGDKRFAVGLNRTVTRMGLGNDATMGRFYAFSNATARLRPRYREGVSSASEYGHSA
ncbi:hypothetical protein [Halocatena halophila]|uniref:hypothetical protein n=1 Tax=Halocatena halophila TaxID=2814576 RepID=UPI002ED679AB